MMGIEFHTSFECRQTLSWLTPSCKDGKERIIKLACDSCPTRIDQITSFVGQFFYLSVPLAPVSNYFYSSVSRMFYPHTVIISGPLSQFNDVPDL
jgi:hypothetical protein